MTPHPAPVLAAEMRVGIGSFAFGWATGHASPAFDEQALIAFASRHAVPVVQIADNLPVHTWPPERIDRLVAEASRAGLTIELGARGLTDDHLQCYLGLCRRVGARLLRFVADADGYEPSPDDLVALLRNAVPALSAAAVTIGLENHDRFPAISLRHIVDAVASPDVGICLDTANSFGAGESLREILDPLAPLAVNMHVKDVRISRVPHMMGFAIEGRPLGDGQLPIEAAIASVRRYRRCQTVILEAWTSPAPTIAETIERERASAVVSIERLKAVLGA